MDNTAPEIPIDRWEKRKLIEHQTYEKVYAAGQEFSDPSIRMGLLGESERYFLDRVRFLVEGKRVLEIGCGSGQHAIFAAKCGAAQVVGVDFSSQALRLAAAGAVQAEVDHLTEFKCLDIEKLNFADQSFDVILNHEVFSSIDLERVLPELKRVLKIGGVLLSIECLGHNPLFNLNRYLNVRRGKRTQWAATHIVKRSTISKLESLFSSVSTKHFHLLALLSAPLRALPGQKFQKIALRTVGYLDNLLLALPIIRWLSFKVVVEAQRQ